MGASATNRTVDEARRTALILSAGQAVVGSAAPICIALGAIAGSFLLGDDKSLATLPVAGYNIGVAASALPAAMLMRAVGRRHGFVLGALLTSLGGAVAALALTGESFWLFAAGLLLVGGGGAFVQQYRFAAADAATKAFKARAISWVLAGGIVAAILGPQLVIWTADAFAPAVPFAGAFLGLIGLGLAGAVILSFLRLPKPSASAGLADAAAARPLWTIFTQQKFVVGLLCAIGAYAMMSFVMTGAPLAMIACGFSTQQSTLGISLHVLAMFGPSFVTGRLIDRFGKETIVATGLLLLGVCSIVALSGIALWQFWLALVLLGIGWNFGFIGATAIVAESYTDEEKNRVQGLHDFLLFGTVAFASLMSGQVFNAFGWETLVSVVFPVIILCGAALLLLRFGPRAKRAS